MTKVTGSLKYRKYMLFSFQMPNFRIPVNKNFIFAANLSKVVELPRLITTRSELVRNKSSSECKSGTLILIMRLYILILKTYLINIFSPYEFLN